MLKPLRFSAGLFNIWAEQNSSGSSTIHHFLNDLMIFAAAAIVAVPLFRVFKMGTILAYLFAGIVIGPSGLGFIGNPATVLQFSELGVVFLLFIIGLELAPAKLWRMRNLIFGLGAAQMAATGLLLTAGAWWLGFAVGPSFVIGFGLALSSTAFGVQMLEEGRQLYTSHGQASFGILMFQDLSVVPLLALVTYLAPSPSNGSQVTLTSIAKAILIFALILLTSRYVMRHALRWIAASRIQEVFLAMSLLIVIGAGVVMESIGFSLGMGAFMAGVLMADSEYRHELESNLMPFKSLLLGLFFIAVGMSLDLGVVTTQPHLLLLGTLAFVSLKAALLIVVGSFFRLQSAVRLRVASTLLQGGEFAFVIFALAAEKKLLNSETASFLGASVTLSMALTPFVYSWTQKRVSSLENKKIEFDTIVSEDPEVVVAGFGRFGQIVTRFLNAQDIRFTILEHSAEQVETARRFGNKVYYGDASRLDILESAGSAKAKMFVLAVDNVEKSLEIARLVRSNYAHLKVFARVRNRKHAIEMMKLGVENVHRETYLTSLEVAKEVLLEKGYSRSRINSKLAEFRSRDEHILKQQMNLIEDEQAFVRYTSAANKELEQILKLEQQEL